MFDCSKLKEMESSHDGYFVGWNDCIDAILKEGDDNA